MDEWSSTALILILGNASVTVITQPTYYLQPVQILQLLTANYLATALDKLDWCS